MSGRDPVVGEADRRMLDDAAHPRFEGVEPTVDVEACLAQPLAVAPASPVAS